MNERVQEALATHRPASRSASRHARSTAIPALNDLSAFLKFYRLVATVPSGCGTRPWLEGRRLCAARAGGGTDGQSDLRLYAARRQLQLSTAVRSPTACTCATENTFAACRPTSSCLRARTSPGDRRVWWERRRATARRPQRTRPRGNSRPSSRRPMRPSSSTSANSAIGQRHRHAAASARRSCREGGARHRMATLVGSGPDREALVAQATAARPCPIACDVPRPHAFAARLSRSGACSSCPPAPN